MEDDVEGLEQQQKPEDEELNLEGSSKRLKVDSCKVEESSSRTHQYQAAAENIDKEEEESKQV